MDLRLAFIDLDDTLLGSDKRISRENREALRRLQRAGVHPVLASGRHVISMREFAAELPEIEWLISMQGALVTDTAGDFVLKEFLLPAETVRRVVDMGLASDYAIIVYARENLFAHPSGPYYDLYQKLSGFTPVILDPAQLIREDVFKVLWLQEPEKIGRIASHASVQQLDAYLVRTHEQIFEFMSPEANKGSAAAALADHLGVPHAACVAFDDGNNDVPMLKWAGQSVAMAHGWEDAKKAAKHVSPPGDPNTAFARAVDLVLGV